MKPSLTFCVTSLLIAFSALTVLYWSVERDVVVAENYANYEACVRSKFEGRTPYQVKEATGAFPECK